MFGQIESDNTTGAAAVSVLLLAISFLVLLGISFVARRGMRDERRLALRTVALGYLAALLVVPVGMVFYRAFEHGFGAAWDAVTTPPAQHAFYLTFVITLIAVPLNAVFGVLTALGARPLRLPRQAPPRRR